MKSYYNEFLFLIFLLFLLFLPSCKEDPPVIPPPPPPVLKDTLRVAITDVTHRSASVNVQCTMNNVQSLIRLYRLFNSSETLISEFSITVQDTTIIDDDNGTGLLLNTNYFYYAVRIDTTGERKDTSNIVEAATLDTTSHNYTWQEYVIGEWQSALYDVWGTDENNVWAVGSLTIGGKFYGAMHWDGTDWIPDSTVGGSAIFGFAANDIWVVGGGVFHFNGNEWVQKDKKIINGTVTPLDPVLYSNSPYTSVWGTSSSNLYLGNAWGKIIQWDGSKASVVYDSGIPITDIYGSSNNNTWFTCQNFENNTSIIGSYNGYQWMVEHPSVEINPILSIYTSNHKNILIGGDGVHSKQSNDWIRQKLNPQGDIYKIRGKKINDLFTVGAFGTVCHFNGSNWKIYEELFTPVGGIYYGLFCSGSKVFVVGIHQNHSQAKILIGIRN